MAKPFQKPNWLTNILTGAEKVLNFLNNITDIERILSAFRKGVQAFHDELKREPTQEEKKPQA